MLADSDREAIRTADDRSHIDYLGR